MIRNEQKIVVLRKQNPLKPGTGAHQRVGYVLACNNKTVEAAKSRGARASTVRFCLKEKLIQVKNLQV